MNPSRIIDYLLTDEDLSIRNPYLFRLMDIIHKLKEENLSRENISSELLKYRNEFQQLRGNISSELLKYRNEFIEEYSFSIPVINILETINSYSPIVEMGAGSGYWAYCLEQLGCDIICYDKFPPGEEEPFNWMDKNFWFAESWVNIVRGDETHVVRHGDRALFMAWPDPESPFAARCLENYISAGGSTLIFIGDRGLTADELFFRMIERFKILHSEELPGWPGIREYLYIFKLCENH